MRPHPPPLLLWGLLAFSGAWCGATRETAPLRTPSPPHQRRRTPAPEPPTLPASGTPRSCRLTESADEAAYVTCGPGQLYFFDDLHAHFKDDAIAATCSYRRVGQPAADFYQELRDQDLLHAVLGQPTRCYDATSILADFADADPLPTHPRQVVLPNGVAAAPCPPGELWLEGRCRRQRDATLHPDPKVGQLIRDVAQRFYRSPDSPCPDKEAFVAFSKLDEVLTGTPIPGAGIGVPIDDLVPPFRVPRDATGVDPLLAVSCGFNNESHAAFRAAFFCERDGTCYQQGAPSLPHNCEAFSKGKSGVGVQFWEHRGQDCTADRGLRNGGEEGTFALRKLGPGVYLKIVQDNWDDAFFHGLVFSRDPAVVQFWEEDP